MGKVSPRTNDRSSHSGKLQPSFHQSLPRIKVMVHKIKKLRKGKKTQAIRKLSKWFQISFTSAQRALPQDLDLDSIQFCGVTEGKNCCSTTILSFFHWRRRLLWVGFGCWQNIGGWFKQHRHAAKWVFTSRVWNSLGKTIKATWCHCTCHVFG